MRYLTRRLLQLDGANSAVHILKELDTLLKAWSLNACMENYDWEHKPSMEGETLLEVGKAAVRSGHYDLFESVAQLHRGALPTDFFTWLQRWLVGKDDVGSEIQKRIRTIKKG
jgi:hypothetical protein